MPVIRYDWLAHGGALYAAELLATQSWRGDESAAAWKSAAM